MENIKININRASEKELQQVQGVGRGLAVNIIAYRQKNGVFSSVDELLRVKGITSRILEQIRPQVFCDPGETSSSDIPLFHFACTPGRVVGEFPVRNAGGAKRVEFKIRHSKLSGRDAGAASDKLVVQRRVGARQNHIRLRIPIDRHASPGEYEAEITAGEDTFRARFEIMEKPSVSISPCQVFLEGRPGDTLEKSFWFANRGNVPLVFKDPGALMLEDHFIECRTIRGAVHKLKDVKSIEEIARVVATQLETLYREAGAMRAKIKGNALEIQPGTIQKCTLAFTLPKNLNPSSRYYAHFNFYDAKVNLVVLPR